jgi:hypothetical protein
MDPQDGPNSGRFGRLLELYRPPDAIGVGAGKGRKAMPQSGFDHGLRARGSLTEGEVRMDVEMSKHSGLDLTHYTRTKPEDQV